MKKQNKKRFMFYLDLEVNEMLEELLNLEYSSKSAFVTKLIIEAYKKNQEEIGGK